ncbi:MAG: AAA family ATPase, partial [Candidatus Aureabacteria bacterium]|nr:AAA family ATPase [Candidatus Auribacterota bacterium]
MEHSEIQSLNEKVKKESGFISRLREQIHRNIVGQEYLIDRLFVGLLADGHVLLEGVPGLAKTLSVSTLANAVQASFKRVQFTPDLLPADLIGTQIYNPKDGNFS